MAGRLHRHLIIILPLHGNIIIPPVCGWWSSFGNCLTHTEAHKYTKEIDTWGHNKSHPQFNPEHPGINRRR